MNAARRAGAGACSLRWAAPPPAPPPVQRLRRQVQRPGGPVHCPFCFVNLETCLFNEPGCLPSGFGGSSGWRVASPLSRRLAQLVLWFPQRHLKLPSDDEASWVGKFQIGLGTLAGGWGDHHVGWGSVFGVGVAVFAVGEVVWRLTRVCEGGGGGSATVQPRSTASRPSWRPGRGRLLRRGCPRRRLPSWCGAWLDPIE